ncbi:MAG: hypothetical protein V3V14_02775 [Saprospiraceae bacterium]
MINYKALKDFFSKTLKLIVFLMLGFQAGNTQNIDSLKNEIDLTQGKDRIDLLISYCKGKEIKILAEAEEIVSLSHSIGYNFGMFSGYRSLANEYFYYDKINLADSLSQLSLKHALLHNSAKEISEAYALRSNIFAYQNELAKAYEAITNQLKHAEKAESHIHIAESFYNFSYLFGLAQDSEHEKYYALKMLEAISDINSSEKSSISKQLVHGTLGYIYLDHNLDSARYHFEKADSLFSLTTLTRMDSLDRSMIDRYYGEFLYEEKDFKKSEQYCQRSLDYVIEFESDSRIVICQICLYKAKLKLGKIDAAKTLLKTIKKKIPFLNDTDLNYEVTKIDFYNYVETLDSISSGKILGYLAANQEALDNNRIEEILNYKGKTELLQKQNELNSKNDKLIIERKVKLLFIGLFLVLFALLVLSYFQYRTSRKLKEKRIKSLEIQQISDKKDSLIREQELVLKEQENQLNLIELEHMKKINVAKSLWQSEKTILLDELKKSLELARKGKVGVTNHDLLKLERKINIDQQQEESWNDFIIHFEKINPLYFKILLEKSPALNQSDLRLCAYIKLNLSAKEISRFLNIKASSVNTARYRLRKKLNLNQDVSLDSYLLSI